MRPRFFPAFLALVLTLVPAAAQPTPAKGSVEAEVLREINAMRTNPKGFAERLRPRLAWFEDKMLKKPGALSMVTNEGAEAVEEAIRFLESASPLPALEPSPRLTAVALEHTVLQAASGKTGHEGANGEKLAERIRRQGAWKGAIAENISYGPEDAFEIAAQFVIDDGVKSRGHRENLFNSKYTLVGLDAEKHAKFGRMCVVVLAQGFADGGK